jgi:hypothetical protein
MCLTLKPAAECAGSMFQVLNSSAAMLVFAIVEVEDMRSIAFYALKVLVDPVASNA